MPMFHISTHIYFKIFTSQLIPHKSLSHNYQSGLGSQIILFTLLLFNKTVLNEKATYKGRAHYAYNC